MTLDSALYEIRTSLHTSIYRTFCIYCLRLHITIKTKSTVNIIGFLLHYPHKKQPS